MRVLIIGQLPRECGGNYTTGIARVVENLYKKDFDDIDVSWYFTNVPQRKIKKAHNKRNYGYIINPLDLIMSFIKRPDKTIKEWWHYRKIDGINPLRYEFYKINFKRVIEKERPNLIHIHGAGLSPLFYATRGKNIIILLTFHGVMYNEWDMLSWHFKPVYHSLMSMADFFTVLNLETKRKALALGMPEEKSYIIPNGVDTDRFFYSPEQRQIIRGKMGVRNNCHVFITTGGVIDRKGQFDFLKILQSLGINYQYWIVGEGEDVYKIKEYVEENKIGDRVRLLGYIDGNQLYKYLSSADYYAHVSTTEGQALSEIEAYATGLRIIVRKEIEKTVIGDVEKDKENYYVLDFSQINKEDITNWVNNTPQSRFSRGKYDWSQVAQQYAALYKELLNE